MARTHPTLIDLLVSNVFSRPAITGRRSLRRTVITLLFWVGFACLQIWHRICLALDEILFPGFRKVDISKPLFIIGPPRSGTTYLHRLVAANTQQFSTFYLWELLLAPAICQKRVALALGRVDGWIGSPLAKLLRWAETRGFSSMQDVHPTSLMDAEEDYFGLLPIACCFLLIVPFPDSRKVWDLAEFDRKVSPADRQRIMNFYRKLLQRHLYVRGPEKHVVSKNPSFCGMINSLSEAFPDARFALPIRRPDETLPSLLSSMQDGTQSFGYELSAIQPELLRVMNSYYRHISENLGSLGDHGRVIPYQDLVSHPNDTLGNLYTDLGYTLDPESKTEVPERRSSQRYQSRHRYTLEQFGLSLEQVRQEFHFAYEDSRMGISSPEDVVNVAMQDSNALSEPSHATEV